MADGKHEVVVTDIHVHFWSMVMLLVKWAIAAIPAVIILYAIAVAVSMALHAVPGPWWHWWPWGQSTLTYLTGEGAAVVAGCRPQ